MAYATISHVNGRCPRRTFTGSSYPNTSQVVGFLDQRAGDLDALLLAQGYALPVPASATIALKVLERANAVGAWADVEAAADASQDLERAQKAWRDEVGRLGGGKGYGPAIELDIPRSSSEAYARGKTIEEAGVASSVFFTPDMEL